MEMVSAFFIILYKRDTVLPDEIHTIYFGWLPCNTTGVFFCFFLPSRRQRVMLLRVIWRPSKAFINRRIWCYIFRPPSFCGSRENPRWILSVFSMPFVTAGYIFLLLPVFTLQKWNLICYFHLSLLLKKGADQRIGKVAVSWTEGTCAYAWCWFGSTAGATSHGNE